MAVFFVIRFAARAALAALVLVAARRPVARLRALATDFRAFFAVLRAFFAALLAERRTRAADLEAFCWAALRVFRAGLAARFLAIDFLSAP